jgi:hypothetical protein
MNINHQIRSPAYVAYAARCCIFQEEILQIRRRKLFTLVVACLIAPAAAKADPVVWTLNNFEITKPSFQPSSLQGSFDYDADTNTYSDDSVCWVFNGNCESPLPIYSTTTDSITFGVSSNSTGFYTLVFGSPLTDAGGDVSLTGSTSGGGTVNSGAYLSAPVATPEPGTLLLVFSGLGGMMLRRRQRA